MTLALSILAYYIRPFLIIIPLTASLLIFFYVHEKKKTLDEILSTVDTSRKPESDEQPITSRQRLARRVTDACLDRAYESILCIPFVIALVAAMFIGLGYIDAGVAILSAAAFTLAVIACLNGLIRYFVYKRIDTWLGPSEEESETLI